jgi:hypothetical protein
LREVFQITHSHILLIEMLRVSYNPNEEYSLTSEFSGVRLRMKQLLKLWDKVVLLDYNPGGQKNHSLKG